MLFRSITPKSLSVLSNNLETLLAGLFFSFTRCLKRYRLIAIMLVSEPEKKADIRTKKAIEANRIQRGISFNLAYPKKDLRCKKCVQVI